MADKPLQSLTIQGLGDTYVNTPLSTAPTFNTTTAYAVGDYVFYNRKLYKFITNHSAGNWDNSQVQEVTIGNEITQIENDLNNKYEKPSDGIPTSDLASGVIPDVSGKADKVQSATSGNFASLDANGNLADSGYKHSDYLTEAPVTDVQVDGTSVVTNGVAEIPIANNTSGNYGLVKLNQENGIYVTSDDAITFSRANDLSYKAGANNYQAVTPYGQHMSTFYGLAKAAGANMSASSNAVGTYTNEAKAAIQNMLGVPSSADVVSDVQLNNVSVVGNGVANIPMANSNDFGVVKVGSGLRINDSNKLVVNGASPDTIKIGTEAYNPIVPLYQYVSTFYGLASASGDTTQRNSSNNVGVYTDEAKQSIQTMLGVPSVDDIPEVPVQDVQIDGTSVLNQGVAEIPIASANNAGVVKVSADGYYGLQMRSDGQIQVAYASSGYIKAGTDARRPIVPSFQHYSAFYGLAKAAGDTTQSASDNAVGTYTDAAKAAIQTMLGVPSADDIPEVPVQDVQVNGTSVLNNGVAEIPAAVNNGTYGVVKVKSSNGVYIASDDFLSIVRASLNGVKNGDEGYNPITPLLQHRSVFYGLAKAAGDTTQSVSDNAVGTYTDEAKTAIKTMLGIDMSSLAPFVEEVSGTTPVITAEANIRYVCGEVATIDITPPSVGTCDVIFESGSTASVLTVPNTVKFPEWFDATSLEVDTIYEIIITDGIYGMVMSWAI